MKLVIDYTLGERGEKDSVEIGGDIRKDKAADIIAEWIRTQMGEGEDRSPSHNRKTYHIEIDLDLSNDSMRATHDCGNKGLRDGILLRVLKKLKT